MSELFFAQAVGFVALFVGGTNFFNKNDSRFKVQTSVFCYVLTFHFLLMGAVTGAAISFISGTRSLISLKSTSYKVMLGFITAFWVIGLPMVTQPYEILPIIGSTFATYAFFRLSGIRMRLVIGINSLCWLIHNIMLFSLGGIMMELLFICINLHTISRLYSERCNIKVSTN